MKRLILVAATVIVGGAAAWFALQSVDHKPGSAAPVVRQGRPELTPAQKARIARAKIDNPQPPPVTRILTDVNQKVVLGRTNRIDSYVSMLQERLNLTSEQVASVKETIEHNGSADGRISSSQPAAAGGTGKSSAETADEAIAALLTPGQRQEYATFQSEQRQQRRDGAVNREIANLQAKIALEPEQVSQLRDDYSELFTEQEEKAHGLGLSPEQIKEMRAERLDTLKKILTPAQMEKYQGQATTAAPPKAN